MSLGDRIAQLIQAQAAPYAQAALERGRAYGQVAHDLGQIGQNLVAPDPARKLAALQVKEAEHAAKSRDVFEKALRDPTHYDEAGNLDEAKVGAFLRKADVGAWQHWTDLSTKQRAATQEYQKKQLEIANSTLDLQGKQQGAEALKRQRLGELAFEGMRMLSDKPDDPLHARDTALALVGRAAAVDKVISPEQAQQFALSLAQAQPGQIGQALASFVSPQQRAELEGKAATQAKTEAETAKAAAERKKLAAETKNLETFGRATPPEAQQADFRLDGRDVKGVFVPSPTGGKYLYNGQDVTSRVLKVPSASLQLWQNPASADTRTNNAEQLFRGNILPADLSKRGAEYNATLAEANKISLERTGKPLNINKLKLDYESAKKFAATLNGQQMVRYRGLADSVVNTIDEVNRLADELKQGDVQLWNRVTRNSVRQVYGNTPQSELANQYIGAVNTLKEEFANLANGGFAPTEAAWKLANDQINGDYGFKDMRASLSEVQRLVNFRTNAMFTQTPQTVGGPSSLNLPAPEKPKEAPRVKPSIKVGAFTVTERD